MNFNQFHFHSTSACRIYFWSSLTLFYYGFIFLFKLNRLKARVLEKINKFNAFARAVVGKSLLPNNQLHMLNVYFLAVSVFLFSNKNVAIDVCFSSNKIYDLLYYFNKNYVKFHTTDRWTLFFWRQTQIMSWVELSWAERKFK